MSDAEIHHRVSQVLFHEADLLDSRQWAKWLAMFVDDCVFWVPAWINETEMTSDPYAQISAIYYNGRSGLEERIARIESNQSIASFILPRTTHAISNVRVQALGAGRYRAQSLFAVDSWDSRSRSTDRLFGTYEHELSEIAGEWRIKSKKVKILNGVLPPVIDFYSV